MLMISDVILSVVEARNLTDQIKVSLEETWQLIMRAWEGRAWVPLGYPGWDDYCSREFGTSRIKLPCEERYQIIVSMQEIGMSQRAISAATGVSPATVNRELSKESLYEDDESAEKVKAAFAQGRKGLTASPKSIGTDGKAYPKSKPKKQGRPPLPWRFKTVATQLTDLTMRLERLQRDDRYRSNRQSIADTCVPQFRRARDVLDDLLNDLDENKVIPHPSNSSSREETGPVGCQSERVPSPGSPRYTPRKEDRR
jgi:hypothetical protein